MDGIDSAWSAAYAALHLHAPHVAVALFHCVHRTPADARSHGVASVTPDSLRRFLDAMLRAGYVPIRSEDIGRSTKDRQLHLTFDDGYFNNVWAVPVLEEFRVPATFFITTSNVLSGTAFWWDAVTRQLAAAGKSRLEMRNMLRQLKALSPSELRQRLQGDFGRDALTPLGDADRPFTPSELRDFSRSRWVCLGNHTAQHTILTRCPISEAAADIAQGRRDLMEITGASPMAIAYPNGDFSAEVIAAAKACGHAIGFTCVPKRNPAEVNDAARMQLGRYLVEEDADYAALATSWAAPWLPGARLRAALQH